MKKVISALTVAAMCASMAASAMPAFAIYKDGDVDTYLKVISADKGTISEDGKTITFATAADAASANLLIGQYFVCDTASVSMQMVQSACTPSSTSIKLSNPIDITNEEYQDSQSYTIGGKTFETGAFVNCFAWVNKRNKYQVGCSNLEFHSNEEWQGDGWVGNGDNDVLLMKWATDFGDSTNYPDSYLETAHFLDTEKSDSLPLFGFNATLSDSIADGVYTIDFLPEYTRGTDGKVMDATWVITGDGKTVVHFGTTEGLTIKVGDATVEPETTEPAQPETTEPAQPETTEPTPVDPVGDENWYFEDTVYDMSVSDDYYVEMPLKVNSDKGRIGYEFQILVDGKVISESALEIEEISRGDAYKPATGTANFLPNTAEGIVGYAYNGADGQINNVVAAAGTTVITVGFVLPDDIKAGDQYEISVNRVTGGDQDSNDVEITVKPGTLKIVDGNTPIETTEPIEDTTAPTEGTTAAPVSGDYLYGDVNEDGKVELRDIVMLNRFLTGYADQTLTDRAVVNANCFRNGESDADTTRDNLDGKDSMEILKYLIKLVETLPTQG